MPSWDTLQTIGAGIGILAGGVWSGLKIALHKQRSNDKDIDAAVGRESAAAMVQRAEDRMRELHDLRNEQSKILGGFSNRLTAVEKDVSFTMAAVSDLKNDMKSGGQKLDAILERVWALPGARGRRQDDPERS